MSNIATALTDYHRRAREAARHTPGGVLNRRDINGIIRSTARINEVEVTELEDSLGLSPYDSKATSNG